MGNLHQEGRISSAPVAAVVDQLVKMFAPEKIYLYSQKMNSDGQVSAFKLCVVAQLPDREQAEQDAYVEIDCEIPFDLLIYTPKEWDRITERRDSFASRIIRTGVVVHG